MEGLVTVTSRAVGLRRAMIVGACFLFAASGLSLVWGKARAGAAVGAISAQIEPGQVVPGEAAVLTVRVSGEATGPPSIAPVQGLRFLPVGRSTQYQSVNGRVSSTVSYLYQVEAEAEGDYTIPPVEARVNGRTVKSGPISLKVSLRGNQRGSGGRGFPPALSRGTGRTRSSRFKQRDENGMAFLRITPSKDRSYVGELVPVDVRAFFRQGVQATLSSVPVMDNSAFSWEGFDGKPVQTREVIEGIGFNVLTWHGALCGVKEGEYPVSVRLEATVVIPALPGPGRDPLWGGFFDDDFFNSFFRAGREETLTLTSGALKLRVMPLPEGGRPKNFTGAVGRFTLGTQAKPKRCTVGDPITLRITVKGRGNFGRVRTQGLTSAKGWKTYSPRASFESSDGPGYRGKKRFEQAIIPMEASVKEIPPVEFCYFDTRERRYVTLKSRPIRVKVEPDSFQAGKGGAAAAYSPEAHDAGSPGSSGNDKGPAGLAPIHVALGNLAPDLRPVVTKPWFIGAQGIPLGLLFAGFLVGRRNRRISSDPGLVRKREVRQKVSRSIREMDRAIAGHDVDQFFNACTAAITQRLGEAWALRPDTITLAEIKARLGPNAEGLGQLFEDADAVAYSGKGFTQEELKKCRDLVMRELKNLDDLYSDGRVPARDDGGSWK